MDGGCWHKPPDNQQKKKQIEFRGLVLLPRLISRDEETLIDAGQGKESHLAFHKPTDRPPWAEESKEIEGTTAAAAQVEEHEEEEVEAVETHSKEFTQ